MNQELLNDLLQKVQSSLGGGDLSSARKVGLVAKVMEIVEKGTNLAGSDKKKYAIELVKMVYERMGVTGIGLEGEELSETIDLLVSVGKGVIELQKKSSAIVRALKVCCKK